MKLKCAVCERERDASTMQVFMTTPAEKRAMSAMGELKPKDSYAYCRACLRILQNQSTAVSLMKGVVQFQARASGVTTQEAEKIANNYGKSLLALTPDKPRS